MAKPKKCISPADAEQLQKNWLNSRAKDIQNAMGKKDTCEFFYTLDDIEKYLTYVKEESAKQGISKPGIRIYFAAYNDEKSKKATIFFTPTDGDTDASANNRNIDPLNKGIGGWPPKPY